jgi:hypothetical protein
LGEKLVRHRLRDPSLGIPWWPPFVETHGGPLLGNNT